MTETTLNQFVSSGTNAERLAYTPVLATPAAGNDPSVIFIETDTGATYMWDFGGAAWVLSSAGGGGITALTGDVTAAGPGSAAATIANNAVTTAKINNAAVTLAKIQNAAASSKLLGSGASGSGAAYVELTLGTNLSMSGTTLNATGGGGTPGGSSGDIQYNNAGAFGGFTMSGDVTCVPSTGVTTIGALKIATGMIQANAVTLAKLATQADQTVLANVSGGSAVPSAVTISAVGGVVLISEVVTSGTQASVTFSSIPATYRDLEVRVAGRGDTVANTVDIKLQYNGDTAGNYSRQFMAAVGNSVSGGSTFSETGITIGSITAASGTTSYSGAALANIVDYRGTTFFKSTESRSGVSFSTTGQLTQNNHGLWLSTSAINAVKAFPSAGNFVNGSVVSLYGRF